MGTRGRKSANDMAVVVALPARPDPPAELTDEQAREWVEVVNRLPADHFPRETHGLLVQYCRHVVASRRVAKLIDAAAEGDLPTLARLLRMQVAQSNAIASLATKMRLSQSSTSDRRRAKGPAERAPWDSWE
ncbi:MAG: hypothetical protein AB7I68_05175 [Porticoccaceae bacterium]